MGINSNKDNYLLEAYTSYIESQNEENQIKRKEANPRSFFSASSAGSCRLKQFYQLSNAAKNDNSYFLIK